MLLSLVCVICCVKLRFRRSGFRRLPFLFRMEPERFARIFPERAVLLLRLLVRGERVEALVDALHNRRERAVPEDNAADARRQHVSADGKVPVRIHVFGDETVHYNVLDVHALAGGRAIDRFKRNTDGGVLGAAVLDPHVADDSLSDANPDAHHFAVELRVAHSDVFADVLLDIVVEVPSVRPYRHRVVARHDVGVLNKHVTAAVNVDAVGVRVGAAVTHVVATHLDVFAPVEEELADDMELVALIAAAVAAYEGKQSTDGFVVRSIRKARRK